MYVPVMVFNKCFTCLYSKTMTSNGPLGGTTSWSPCLTPTSSGLGMKSNFTLCITEKPLSLKTVWILMLVS